MKKIVNKDNSKQKLTSLKKKKYNTIQTYEDKDLYTQSKKFRTQIQESIDKSIGNYSTKSKNKRDIQWSQLNEAQNKQRRISTSNLKIKKSINKKLSFKKSVENKIKSKSISNIKVKQSHKQSNTKQIPIQLENFQTFEPKCQFIEGFMPIKKITFGDDCNTIWVAKRQADKKRVLIKQNKSINEIQISQIFLFQDGKAKREYSKHPGIKNLFKMLEVRKTNNSNWIVYEQQGQSLHNHLFNQTFSKNVLHIEHKHFYETLKLQQNLFKKLIVECCKGLSLISQKSIVHGKIRGENIFITFKEIEKNKRRIEFNTIKLGSFEFSFEFKDFQKKLPQLINLYTPPQILNYILFDSKTVFDRKMLEYMEDYHNGWVIDMWSLGLVLLEVLIGVPFSVNSHLIRLNKSTTEQQPFFSEKDTLKDLIEKQFQLVFNLDKILQDKKRSSLRVDIQIQYIIKRMLSIDPKKRISPKQVISLLKA